jgi:serine/threonine protein kinase
MSVAAVTAPDWKQWEGDIVDGEFPLEQFLGAGQKSAVFRTRLASGEAAIKLVPSGKVQADELVERWNRSRELDHPHLIGIVRTGTWAKAGTSLAYLVMEYADDNLAMVLLERALTANETLEMLQPVAEVLRFLHDHGFCARAFEALNYFGGERYA